MVFCDRPEHSLLRIVRVLVAGLASLGPAVGSVLATSPETRPNIVLLHGWASDAGVWDILEPKLAAVGRPVALDAPGHRRGDTTTFSFGSFADASRDRAESRSSTRTLLVAHSNGAYAAREYYRRHRSEVCGIVLLDGTFRRQFDDADAFRKSILSMTEADWARIAASMSKPAGASQATLEKLPVMLKRIPFPAVVQGSQALLEPSLYQEDPIAIPLLLVTGPNAAWTADHLTWLRRIAPKMHREHIDGVSHWLAWDAPDRVAAIISSFADSSGCKGPN